MCEQQRLRRFEYMWCSDVMAEVVFDEVTMRVVSVNSYTDDIVKHPFGLCDISIIDMHDFFMDRCLPRGRDNLGVVLEGLGVREFDPYLIVQKTHGRLWDDFAWIRFEGEDLDFDRDIRLRD